MSKQHGEKVEWEGVMEFVDGDLVVEVRKLPLRRPRFSIAIGKQLADGKIGRFIGIFTNGQGKITVEDVVAKIEALVSKAQSYVLDEAQRAEDEFIARQQRYEENRGGERKGKPCRVGTHGRVERA